MVALGAVADELSEVAEQALMDKIRWDVIQAPISALRKITEEAKRAWSGSNIGYHADVYFAGLQPAPSHARFNPEWGLMERFGTHGPHPGWGIMYRQAVIDTLLDRAGLATDAVEAIENELDALGALFAGLRERTISLLTAANSAAPDPFLARKLEQVEKLIRASPNTIEHSLVPKAGRISRDSEAVYQGLRPAPHQYLIAIVLAADLLKRGFEAIETSAREAAQHITRFAAPSKKARVSSSGTSVFLGHGRSAAWRELRDFLKERLGLTVDEFNSTSAAGKPTAIRLGEMLDSAAFAFLVMTAEDEQPDGTLRARENVVHEAGLFQGASDLPERSSSSRKDARNSQIFGGSGRFIFRGERSARHSKRFDLSWNAKKSFEFLTTTLRRRPVPHTEHVSCQFKLTQSGERNRPLLQIDFTDKGPSALANPTKRVFFTFHESVTWDEAEAVVAELDEKISHMGVTAYAPGESM